MFEDKVGQKQEAQREIGGGKGNRERERVGRVKYIQTLIIEMSERESQSEIEGVREREIRYKRIGRRREVDRENQAKSVSYYIP